MRGARSWAATIPNCKAYDPAYAGEMAVIVDAGMREMVTEQRDVFYYVTLMNENYAQPDLPEGAAEGVLRGCYVFNSYKHIPDVREWPNFPKKVTLLVQCFMLGGANKKDGFLVLERRKPQRYP